VTGETVRYEYDADRRRVRKVWTLKFDPAMKRADFVEESLNGNNQVSLTGFDYAVVHYGKGPGGAGQGGGIERGGDALLGNDVVALGHRWWLLCVGVRHPMIRLHRAPEPPPIFSTFHYGRDIIRLV
jgi:hypothetical protein